MKKILTFLILILGTASVFALRSPDGYQQEIKYSKIKAIAKVEKVKITDWENGHQTKKVWFKTIKAFNKTTPREFTGYCMSFKNKWFWENEKPGEGGYIFRYPKKGATVIVAVQSNNSYVTSYKELDENAQTELMNKSWSQLKVKPSEVKVVR